MNRVKWLSRRGISTAGLLAVLSILGSASLTWAQSGSAATLLQQHPEINGLAGYVLNQQQRDQYWSWMNRPIDSQMTTPQEPVIIWQGPPPSVPEENPFLLRSPRR